MKARELTPITPSPNKTAPPSPAGTRGRLYGASPNRSQGRLKGDSRDIKVAMAWPVPADPGRSLALHHKPRGGGDVQAVLSKRRAPAGRGQPGPAGTRRHGIAKPHRR